MGGIERRPLAVIGIEAGEIEKQVTVDVRRGEEDLGEFDLAARGGIRRDALLRAESCFLVSSIDCRAKVSAAAACFGWEWANSPR